MILIPSAFIQVFFEPITIPLIRFWHKMLWYLKWVGYCVIYLLVTAAIVFSVIMLFVFGSEVCKYLGV